MSILLFLLKTSVIIVLLKQGEAGSGGHPGIRGPPGLPGDVGPQGTAALSDGIFSSIRKYMHIRLNSDFLCQALPDFMDPQVCTLVSALQKIGRVNSATWKSKTKKQGVPTT